MLKILYTLYYWLIAVPLFVAATILFSLLSIIFSLLGGKGVAYWCGKWWSLFSVYIFLCPVKVVGRENLPERKRPVVIMANHQGALDIFMIYGFIGKPFRWIMKASLKKVPFLGQACTMAGFIYVDEKDPTSIKDTLRDAQAVLSSGTSIAIFPEGHRTATGEVMRFKKGGFVMAHELSIPILPITLEGPYSALPKGKWQVRPTRLTMTIHPLYTISKEDPYPRNLVRAVQEVKEIIESPLQHE